MNWDYGFELLKKEREVNICWKTIRFTQKTLRECLEFHYDLIQDDFNIIKWVKDFLKDCNSNFTEKDFQNIDIEKTFDFLLQKLFTWYFSDKKTKEVVKNKKQKIPYSSYLLNIWDNDITKVDKILDMTPEAINYLVDGKVYNINEQTEKWRNKNRINQDIKQTDDSERQKILDGAKYYDEKTKNKINNN